MRDERGDRYYDDSAHIWCTPGMGRRPNLCYTWRGFTNPHPSGWRLSRERMDEDYEKGNIVILPDGRLQRRKYERDYDGSPLGSIWSDETLLIAGGSHERTGWSTQKPVALYERIIGASSSEGDLVLDPFCGCSTTLVAAERLGRQWIGCDIDPQAEPVVAGQMGTLLDPEQRELFREAGEMTIQKAAPRRTDIPRMADAKLRELVCRQQHQRCRNPYCDSRPRAVDLHLDHKIPKVRGGSDAPENRIGLCGNCNTRKGRKGWGAFLNAERAAKPHPEHA